MPDSFWTLMLTVVNRGLRGLGYQVAPTSNSVGSYIDAAKTVEAAKERGLSIREYVEDLWDQKGATERVVERMRAAGSLAPSRRVCEIGPGTGRYLELVLEAVSPEQYDIYETADDWATWLASTYAPVVARHSADGHSLQGTPDKSCGLVHVHGVFVYLSFLNAFEYFAEMIRVCQAGGYLVFDFYSDEDFNMEAINRWLQSVNRYPVVLSRAKVLEYFEANGFALVDEFENKHGQSYSHYLILRNR
jgi:ubiquinone/menaquinone biosynthesis C-methylase UbiE